MSDMTRAERAELARVVRMRAKVARNGIEARKAELLADFETQVEAKYSFDDAAWADITAAAKRAVEEADAKIAALGIPAEFRPELMTSWYRRGHNASKELMAELRKVAVARLDALAKTAKTLIDRAELDAATALVADGLETSEARAWLDRLPTVEAIMPRISLPEIELTRKAEPRRSSLSGHLGELPE